ncbi:MAG: TolC family protein [Chitinophagaceae bacterium]
MAITEKKIEGLFVESDDISRREELRTFSILHSISGNVLKMNRSYGKPRLNAFMDFAAQGFDFEVKRNSFFYLGGLQLQVPLYTGKRNLYRIDQTKYDLQSLDLRTAQTRQQLNLAALNARNNARSAYNTYRSSGKKQEVAQQYFKLIDRGYREGVNSYIEFLDARNQLSTAQLEHNISKYRLLATLAEYERQTASLNLH